MNGLLRTSHCSGAGFVHPQSWLSSAYGTDVVVALEPARPDGGFRANLVLTVMDNDGLSFWDWQARTDRMLPLLLRDYSLIDLERLEVAGHPGGRRCARHVSPSGSLVLTNQWFTAVDGRGITLSGTADVSSFGVLRAQFAEAAAALAISGTAVQAASHQPAHGQLLREPTWA